MSDFIAGLGSLGLTLRLKRLADRLAADGKRLYASLDMPLEPHGYALLLLLREHEPLSIMEASSHLGLSHPAVIQIARKLEAGGFVEAHVDPSDRRRRLMSLSETARERMPELERVWDAFRQELAALIDAEGSDLLASVSWLEASLAARGLDSRVRERLDAVRPDTGSHKTSAVRVRPAAAADRAAVIHIGRELVRARDTYAYESGTSDEELWRYWVPEERGWGYVAVLGEDVVGTSVLRPNHPGPGSHVANASFAARADMRGMGVGRKMGEAALVLAAELGFRAMQFNIVVSTNAAALRLWRSLGFRVVGTIPNGFQLPGGGFVAYHIMYRSL